MWGGAARPRMHPMTRGKEWRPYPCTPSQTHRAAGHSLLPAGPSAYRCGDRHRWHQHSWHHGRYHSWYLGIQRTQKTATKVRAGASKAGSGEIPLGAMSYTRAPPQTIPRLWALRLAGERPLVIQQSNLHGPSQARPFSPYFFKSRCPLSPPPPPLDTRGFLWHYWRREDYLREWRWCPHWWKHWGHDAGGHRGDGWWSLTHGGQSHRRKGWGDSWRRHLKVRKGRDTEQGRHDLRLPGNTRLSPALFSPPLQF